MRWHAGCMMSDMRLLDSPRKFFWSGLVCVFLGFLLPLLIVIKVIENSFALSFFIYFLQAVGMILGVIAAAGIALKHRRKREIRKKEMEDQEDQEDTTGWME